METEIHKVCFRPLSIGNHWVEPSSRSLAFYFGYICYSEFSRKRSFFSDLGFGLKRACIRTGGHPGRGGSSAWTSRPGKSSNGTESRANEHFHWPPNSPKRPAAT